MLAIIQNGDTPQLESSAVMLHHAGYEVKHCGKRLRDELKSVGCDTVLAVEDMYALGYDALDPSIKEASLNDMLICDLFCEIKVRNIPKITARWPRLAKRMVYLRVNGAEPEICPKGGDEVNLPCPIITACLWYGCERYKHGRGEATNLGHLAGKSVTPEQLREWAAEAKTGDNDMAYTCWPPYPRSAEYDSIDRSRLTVHAFPYCLAHSARAWGYGPIVDDCVNLGVRVFGNNAPAGQIRHRDVPQVAAAALALVHLKSVDCPGWALYEAMLAGCPVITGRLLNSRMLAYDLLIDGETCLEFGVPASLEHGRGDMNYPKCLMDIADALEVLKDPKRNLEIGQAGRERLNELLWAPERDGPEFLAFMRRHFP